MLWKLLRYLKSLVKKPDYNFKVTWAENFIDVSYGLDIKSYRYAATCRNTGKSIRAWVYGDTLEPILIEGKRHLKVDLLTATLNKGVFPGSKY
jgi:hypothetical protein